MVMTRMMMKPGSACKGGRDRRRARTYQQQEQPSWIASRQSFDDGRSSICIRQLSPFATE